MATDESFIAYVLDQLAPLKLPLKNKIETKTAKTKNPT
jgi:hypothetical protein